MELAKHAAEVTVCLGNNHLPSFLSSAAALALSPRLDLGSEIADFRASVSTHSFLKGNLSFLWGKKLIKPGFWVPPEVPYSNSLLLSMKVSVEIFFFTFFLLLFIYFFGCAARRVES